VIEGLERQQRRTGIEMHRTGSSAIVIYSPRELGGVRHVTECLASGIEQNGRTVIIARSLDEVVRARVHGGATEAILSLEAGYLSFLFRRSVYILHGFPRVDSYSTWRRVAVRMAARIARRGGSRLVAVSHLTRAVHERFYGIPVDAVVFNGCSESLNDRAAEGRFTHPRDKAITYVGRLIEGKGLRRIVRGFVASRLPARGYELRVAGSGPLRDWVLSESRASPSVRVLGEVSEAEKEDLLFDSEAFVSLNDFEPMGVVFAEAVLAGCKIVAPLVGGHREFIPLDHPVSLCDPGDVRSVAKAFDRVPSLEYAAALWGSRVFSYPATIAPAYLQVLDGEGASGLQEGAFDTSGLASDSNASAAPASARQRSASR
jgi:glycosyltransferase involved in cell wall biosynthesis